MLPRNCKNTENEKINLGGKLTIFKALVVSKILCLTIITITLRNKKDSEGFYLEQLKSQTKTWNFME